MPRGAPNLEEGVKRDSRGREIASADFNGLVKTERMPGLAVCGLLHATPLEGAFESKWSVAHVDELIVDPALQRRGLGVYMLDRWVKRIESKAVVPTALKDKLRAALGIDEGEASPPFVTLYVDEWNEGAGRFYYRLGFHLVPTAEGDDEHLAGRLYLAVKLPTLKRRIDKMMAKNDRKFADDDHGRVPKDGALAHRTRAIFTGTELERLLYSKVGRKKWWQFDSADLRAAAADADPAAQIALHLANVYAKQFREHIFSHREQIDTDAIAMLVTPDGLWPPESAEEINDEIVELFALDRLLAHKTPRVTMSKDEWLETQSAVTPTRDLEQFARARFTVQFIAIA